jgi:hypothetical protein
MPVKFRIKSRKKIRQTLYTGPNPPSPSLFPSAKLLVAAFIVLKSKKANPPSLVSPLEFSLSGKQHNTEMS